jgi:cysteine synthase B
MEGWKHLETAVVPPIYDEHLADGFLELDTAEVYDMMKKALRMEGLRLSPSSAANLLGAIRVAETLESGTVVTVFPDNADKYGDLLTHLDI